jgi:hypothetical protein
VARSDNNVQLLPDDAVPGEETSDVFDESTLHVNFTTQEADSEARTYEALPSGKYRVYVTGLDRKQCGPESKNPGKPMWALELTVAEGPYVGRKAWTNVMLFDGALYTIAQIMKAMGLQPGKDPIPQATQVKGGLFGVLLANVRDDWKIKKEGWVASSGEPQPRKAEVKGFMSADAVTVNNTPTTVGGSKSGQDALLP